MTTPSNEDEGHIVQIGARVNSLTLETLAYADPPDNRIYEATILCDDGAEIKVEGRCTGPFFELLERSIRDNKRLAVRRPRWKQPGGLSVGDGSEYVALEHAEETVFGTIPAPVSSRPMTTPSREAQEIVEHIMDHTGHRPDDIATDYSCCWTRIDALVAEKVAAEALRWFEGDPSKLYAAHAEREALRSFITNWGDREDGMPLYHELLTYLEKREKGEKP